VNRPSLAYLHAELASILFPRNKWALSHLLSAEKLMGILESNPAKTFSEFGDCALKVNDHDRALKFYKDAILEY
jgi:hypothetical protein